MSIKINNTDIVIRPSSVDSFQQCQYQWAKVFLEGVTTIPSSRAAIGSGIHKGIEEMWKEAINSGKKDPNTSMMFDAAIESFKKEAAKEGMSYNDGETITTCSDEIIHGTQAFVNELVPFLDIPIAVEKRFTVDIEGHPIVDGVSGTVDYIAPGRIDDIKTSKRKPTVANYVTQQSIYKFLAQENGHVVNYSMIQSVVLKKEPACHILELKSNIPQAKYLINNILDTIEAACNEVAPMEVLFKCNTKYYLCSKKYCSLHGSCPATKQHKPVEQLEQFRYVY